VDPDVNLQGTDHKKEKLFSPSNELVNGEKAIIGEKKKRK
jgi:hypothetical protein